MMRATKRGMAGQIWPAGRHFDNPVTIHLTIHQLYPKGRVLSTVTEECFASDSVAEKTCEAMKKKSTFLTNALIVMHITAMNLCEHVDGLCPAIKHNEQFVKKTLIPFHMFLAT